MTKKILFANDGPLFKDNDGNYYGENLDDSLRKRYLYLGSKVTFLIRVRAIDSGMDASRMSKLSMENFEVIEVPDAKSIQKFFKNYLKSKKVINEAVKNHDILVSRMPSLIGKIAFYQAKKDKIPTLVECVGCTFDSYWNFDWRGKLIAHFKKYQQKRALNLATHVVYVTKLFLQDRYPTTGKSINCSNVELNPVDEISLKNRINKINNQIEHEPLVLGTVAGLVPYKGQDDVIRAIGLLHRNGIDFKYRIAGNGNPDYLNSIIKTEQVEDLVTIHGHLNHKDIYKFYEEIDLYIQPSKQEGLPRALIEAMSMAAPALGAKTAGIPELIDEKFIFHPGNYKNIAKLLEDIDKNVMKNAAEQNFITSKDYQKETLFKKRLSFYDQFKEDFNLD